MISNAIYAVIVTYHPDVPTLQHLVARLAPQVDRIAIVDNGTPNLNIDLPSATAEKTTLIFNNENMGLAAAYNLGIQLAQQNNASHIALFDQDSFPAEDMIATLSQTLRKYNQKKLCVAAAGPMYSDVKGQTSSPFVRLAGIHLQRINCQEEQVVKVDHLISSGSLIDLRAVDLIGKFTDSLFIDYVDTEWCWRARRKQLELLGVGSAKMQHNLGEAHFMAFGKARVLHSPFRLYYQMRNQWWMILQPWVGWQWRAMDIIRSAKIFLAISLFSPDRKKRIRYMCKGLFDAFRSRMGKLQD